MTLKALRSSTLITALVSAAILSATPAFAAGNAVATVNGTAIPQSLANLFIQNEVANGQQDSPELRNAVRENLIMRELIIQDAKKAGLDKNPNIQAQMKLAEQSVLIRAFEEVFASRNPVTEAELKEAYKQVSANAPKEEVKMRLMGFDSEAKAKDAISKLDSGTSFASLAAQSDDPGLKANGGDLGWGNPNALPKPLADMANKLGKGKNSAAPIQVNKLWFVLQVEDRRTAEAVAPFDQIKGQLAQAIQAERFQQYLAKQRAGAKIQ